MHRYRTPLIFCILLLACEKKLDTLVDSTGSSPIILSASVNPSKFNTDTINIGAERNPTDVLQLSVTVRATVIHPAGRASITGTGFLLGSYQGSTGLSAGVLHDDGVFPDLIANDSLYSATVNFFIVRQMIGQLPLQIFATSGLYESNTFILPVTIVRANHAPGLANLVVKDTFRLLEDLRIALAVSDSDGLGDLLSVGYVSRKPDGQLANGGNSIPLQDDGNPNVPSGDAIAGDGAYSYRFPVPADAQVGLYTYTFRAIDRSRDTSNTLIKQVRIIP
jgi:hypothetical protein